VSKPKYLVEGARFQRNFAEAQAEAIRNLHDLLLVCPVI